MNEDLNKIFEGVELSDEVKSALTSNVESFTNGLVENRNNIIKENRGFKDQLSQLQSQVESFSGKEEELNKFKKIFEENEEARLIAEGKYQDVIDSKVNGYKTELENFKTSKQAEIDGYNQTISGLQEKIYDYMLNEQISNVALKDSNFDKSDSSLQILKMLAKQSFKAGEDGSFKFIDETKLDKDGNPLNFESWFNTEIKQNFAQLFTGIAGADFSQGGKAPQNKGVDANSIKNMSMAEYRKMRKGK